MAERSLSQAMANIGPSSSAAPRKIFRRCLGRATVGAFDGFANFEITWFFLEFPPNK
jgi:hypothetical protein